MEKSLKEVTSNFRKSEFDKVRRDVRVLSMPLDEVDNLDKAVLSVFNQLTGTVQEGPFRDAFLQLQKRIMDAWWLGQATQGKTLGEKQKRSFLIRFTRDADKRHLLDVAKKARVTDLTVKPVWPKSELTNVKTLSTEGEEILKADKNAQISVGTVVTEGILKLVLKTRPKGTEQWLVKTTI